MDDLLSEFVAETRDTLDALSGEVIAWEADPHDRARLDAIFRFVHTVKGSCGFLDLPRFARLSHAAEDVLSELRAGRRQPDAALVSAMLAILDRIGELTEALDAGEPLPDSDDTLLIAALSAHAPTANMGTPVSNAKRLPARSIRVPLDLLDRMMNGVSDMVLARNELSRRLRGLAAGPGIEGAFERLSGCIAEMRHSITLTRMQRIDKLFSALPRTVRDLAAELNKAVRLEVDGADVELDREMIELIRDPLTHMVRNAIDHGIEPPDERVRRGKPAAGRLCVGARQSGNEIVIEVADDGCGLDEEKLMARAIASGLVTPEAAETMSAVSRARLIFAPGLTTADRVSAISGRGVGMDVVKSNIERIGGTIEIENRRGIGLRFIIRVPLTLTIIAALTVKAGAQTFAIARSAIEEIVHDSNEMIRIDSVGKALIVNIRGRALPLLNLETVLGIDAPIAPGGRTLVVLKAVNGLSYTLGVTSVHDHEELVIKSVSPGIMAIGLYAGESLPDSGIPMLLLDVAGIAAFAGIKPDTDPLPVPANDTEPEQQGIGTLLFRNFQGVRQGIRLSVVERLEEISPDQVSHVAGRLRVAIDGRLLPLAGFDRTDRKETVKILRLSDGETELAYAIDDVIDIVELPSGLEAAAGPGPTAGVAMVEGDPVELLDPYWLFGSLTANRPVEEHAPRCLLLGEKNDRWIREILCPLIEAAGYRVGFADDGDLVEADVVIAPSGVDAAPLPFNTPVVRLRTERPARHAGDDSIYRYDRSGLLAALHASLSQRTA